MPEIIGSTGNPAVSAKIIYTLTQSVQNNTSTISATLYVRRPNDGYTSYGSTNVTMAIGSATQTSWCYFNIGKDGSTEWQALLSYSQTITHNADGTHAAVTISSTSTGSGTTIDPIAVSGSVSLPTIARASQPSCPTTSTFGSTILIATNRASSSFTHTLVITMAAGSGGTAQSTTITGVEAARNFQIPASWAAAIPKGISATLVVTCTTFSGATQIGSAKTCSCSVSVPAGWVPSVSLAASVYNGFNGVYLQGRSAVDLTASSGTASTGSTIQSYAFSGPGISKTVTTTSSSPAAQRTSTLTAAGTMTYKVVITDARGRTGSATVSITCTAYTAPTITMQVTRCNSDGTANDYGEYAKAIVTGTLTTVTGNSATIDVGYKVLGAANYTGLNSWTNLTAATNTKTSNVFAAASTNQYEIRSTITDAVGRSAYVVLTISTAYAIMDVYKDEVVAFGAQAGPSSPGTGNRVHMAVPFADDEMYAQNNDGYGWGRLFNDNYTGYGFRGAALSGKAEGTIPDNTNFNDLWQPGTYFVRSNANANTMTNMPIQKAGALFVLSGNGNIGGGAYSYRRQIYVVALGDGDIPTRYERHGNTNAGTTFTWTAWKTITEITDANIGLSTLTQTGTAFLLDNSSGTEVAAMRVKNAYSDVGLYSATNRGIYDYIVSDWILRRNFMEGKEAIRTPAVSMMLGSGWVSPYVHDTGWQQDPTMAWLKYRRLDNHIYLLFVGDSVTINTGAYRDMGTLPEQYRPTYALYNQVFVANSNNLVLVYITTAGKIQMRNMSSNNSVTFRGSVNYPGQTWRKSSNQNFQTYTLLSYNVGMWTNGTREGMTAAEYSAKISGMQRLFNQIAPSIGFMTEYREYIDANNTHLARNDLFPSGTYPGYSGVSGSTDAEKYKHPVLVARMSIGTCEWIKLDASAQNWTLATTISISGYTVYVYCVHLHPAALDRSIRDAEVTALINRVKTQDNVIICGDFNFVPASYHSINSSSPNTDEHKTEFAKFKTAGFEMADGDFMPWIGTWPSTNDYPAWATAAQQWYLDNILVKGRVKLFSASVPVQAKNYMMSDHLPIVATIGIIGE